MNKIGIETLIVGQLKTNCYLVYNQEEKDCFIIDPGDDAGFIINKIKDLDLQPRAVVCTHGHFDHLLAVTELKLAFDIPFYLHSADLPILKRGQSTAEYFLGCSVDKPVMPDVFLDQEQSLKAEGLELKVFFTPGHTQGSSSFLIDSQEVVFVGDLLFAGGSYGRTDLQGGSLIELKKSLKKILALPGKTVIYPGHDQKTTVIQERKFYHRLLR